MDSFYNYFGVFTTFICVIPICIGILNFRKLPPILKPVLTLLFIVFITECLNKILSYYIDSTYPITRTYTLLEFICLTLFYKLFFKDHVKPYVFYLALVAFTLVALADAFLINSIYRSDTIASATEGIMVLCYSLGAFYLIMRKMLYEDVLKAPFFWINSAYLIYFSGTLFLFVFLNYIIKSQPNYFYQLYFINSLLNLVSYTLISIGFWKTRKA